MVSRSVLAATAFGAAGAEGRVAPGGGGAVTEKGVRKCPLSRVGAQDFVIVLWPRVIERGWGEDRIFASSQGAACISCHVARNPVRAVWVEKPAVCPKSYLSGC